MTLTPEEKIAIFGEHFEDPIPLEDWPADSPLMRLTEQELEELWEREQDEEFQQATMYEEFSI